QYVLPTNGPLDVQLMANITPARSPSNSVLTIGTAPLLSATRYYLAVFNDNPAESNQFTLAVNFFCDPSQPLAPNVVEANQVVATTNYYRVYLIPGCTSVRFFTSMH